MAKKSFRQMRKGLTVSSGTSKTVVAVLGASGFIGRHLMTRMGETDLDAIGIVRARHDDLPFAQRIVPDFRDSFALGEALSGVGRVIHLADEAGRFISGDAPPIAATLAKVIGNRRLIFASSIYARLHTEGHTNPYGARKVEQEKILLANANAIGLRLPPVYGDGCGGSFAMLDKAVAKGIPLPLGRAKAQRSYISVGNVCDLILKLVTASNAQWCGADNSLYEPEDGHRVSTRDLVVILARRHHRSARLVPVPRTILDLVAKPIGRRALVAGAFDPLEARGNDQLFKDFCWKPRESLC